MKKLILMFLLGILIFPLISTAGSLELVGAGATFPYPLYSKMFDEYYKEFGTKVNYQAIGSGGGIRQLQEMTVDFGATDAFMSDEEVKTKDGNEIIHIPMCLGAVVITYRLPGNPKIKLDGETIALIFLGKIVNWNDERIQKQNPDIKLPEKNIIVVHRSDGSGTTFIFSDYLSKVNSVWKEKVGTGKSLNWPVGLGAKGNSGVAGIIQQTPYSIGYVELIYAENNGMPVAEIKNKSGNYIMPSIKSVSASANVKLPEHSRVSLTDTDAEDGYPLSSFTWIIVYKEQKCLNKSEAKAKELVKLLKWMISDGQKFAEPLKYAPLSEEALKIAENLIGSMTYSGKKI